ncbi:hypothetical protein [Butyrivibrio sp. AE2032]|uniref:hypothetical protein n=1 Tax=Butyrivibrio sp. AE2032 TaxID=1458463 RepID=UPI000551DAFF|nr:hypothetical protein [Butyrivibrio sp. AE2032]
MKRILALALASVMMVSSTICVCAAETTTEDQSVTMSPETKKVIEDLQKEIQGLETQINDLIKAVQASQSKGGGGSSSSSSTPPAPPTSSGNSVSYGGTVAYQGGKVEINGGRSNVTFTIKAPSGGVMTSANSLATRLGGSLLTCINTSSPGVAFSNAKVNFFVSGVTNADNIAVYQNQNGTWVQLVVSEVRQDHVVVNLSKHGDIAFIRVPVLATVTH